MSRQRLSKTLTNYECICLYLAYRDGAVTTDLANYFGIKLTDVAAVVRRVEREARRRGYDVKSCIRERGRGYGAISSRYKLNHDIYDDLLANPVVDDDSKYGTEYKLHVPIGGGGYDDVDA